MAAQQANLDLIADNLANADVPGFKAKAAIFTTIGGDASLGTAWSGTSLILGQGKLAKSGGPFDCAIDGRGFFVVERGRERAYTRAGAFTRQGDGTLANADGWRLAGIRIPQNVLALRVEPNGEIVAEGGSRGGIGRIRLATFDAPERLRPIGTALFAPTPASGSPRTLAAGGDHQPKILFGMIERANVSIIEAMMEILSAQRAYEANAKGVQAADEMQRIANNLHRS